MNEIVAHYMIEDLGDGSAGLRLFKTEAELEEYLKKMKEDQYERYDLSEGGGVIYRSDLFLT